MHTTKFLLFIAVVVTLKTTEVQGHTHSDKPLMLLVSFDGFRWDYLKTYNLPNFEYLKASGSHAEFIYNSFATVTFPNHWTIVTGLYEESHGIVQNVMFDPVLNKKFQFTSPDSETIEWYGQNKAAEPIWVTNQKGGNGRRSAAEWVGAGVVFDNQKIVHIPFNSSTPYKSLIDQFVTLYTDKDQPINFGALYFDEPDHTGHLYGPYSVQMKEKLFYLDQTLGYMIQELKSHHLFDKMNLIITSDHGMEQISKETSIFLDSHIDTELFDAYGSRSVNSIFVKKPSDLEYVYKTLKQIQFVDVIKKSEIPDELHYKNNVRIGDLIIVSKLGYSVYINNQTINWTINSGDHGYYNNESSMHPIFIAHGPSFKTNFTINSFNNVDIYPLMCLLLGVQPAANNGSIANVIDMLIYEPVKYHQNFLFLLLLLIPLVLLLVTGSCLCIIGRANVLNDVESSTTGYKTVGTSDAALFVENESDGDVSPVQSSHNTN
jgi:ectonucleotide pyrophosphatase/phosphodiesterase family protein 5